MVIVIGCLSTQITRLYTALESPFHEPKHIPKWDPDCYLVAKWSLIHNKTRSTRSPVWSCFIFTLDSWRPRSLHNWSISWCCVEYCLISYINKPIIYDVRFWIFGMATNMTCLYICHFCVKHADFKMTIIEFATQNTSPYQKIQILHIYLP